MKAAVSRVDVLTGPASTPDDVAALVDRLIGVALRGLPAMRVGDGFVFTMRGVYDAAGRPRVLPEGSSLRYTAITALGARLLPEDRQRAVLGGVSVDDLVAGLVSRVLDTGTGAVTSLGDVALVCWAAAACEHEDLPRVLARLAAMDAGGAVFTVDAAWVLSALAAAREVVGVPDLRSHYEWARRRLLLGVREGGLFAHEVNGRGLVPSYRAHVGCFADQVYPIQALARAGDEEAVRVADRAAERICTAQGDAGQWWWHYDARTGGVVEGYPVYSVHQHAMAPMALLDLAEAGGTDHAEAIRRGLRWMADAPETDRPLILDDLGVTWRKVARRDPRKAVRGTRAMTTRVRPGWRVDALDRVVPPNAVDTECRPYEFGWLLFTWLNASQGGTR